MHKLPVFVLASLAIASTPQAGAGIAPPGEAALIQEVESPFPATEIFPVEPGINAERGFAVAVDGDWLAMGAHREDRDIERDGIVEEKDAGAVYLFKWSGTTWDQKAKLLAAQPQQDAHLGFALAMRDGVLAAAAPGEGVVYVFEQGINGWKQVETLAEAGHGLHTFGRSLALGDGRLAIGAFGAHGTPEGAVYLYDVKTWTREKVVRPHEPQKGERFGASVSLAGGVLVVGAPGYDTPADDAGAVYVFELQPGPALWKEAPKLFPPGRRPQAGQQLGSAVATDGARIFAGAPTADPLLEDGEDGNNAGVVYGFVRDGGAWERQDLPDVEDLAPGDQLGASLALSGDFLVVGAPAPPPGTGEGKVHLFRHIGASWSEVRFPLAGNAGVRDLAGFAVAVDDVPDDAPDIPKNKRVRVVVGGVLGDQGDGAAGATWSFRCPEGPKEEEEKCAEEAEAVARDPVSGFPFGASVALTDQLLVVGALPRDGGSAGMVYMYRRTRNGWRQEARLISPYLGDGFGASVVAVEDRLLAEGTLLAIGAPGGRSSSVSGSPEFPAGGVDLFVRRGSSWAFETTLEPSDPDDLAFAASVAFGNSLAAGDGVLAVGVPGSGKVYVFQKEEESRTWKTQVLTAPDEGFGSAISLHGRVLAIGAPDAGGGVGAVYVSARQDNRWSEPQPLLGRVRAEAVEQLHLGASVSVGDGFLAVGAPGFHNGDGAVFVFEGEGTSWRPGRQISARAPRRFGSSVTLHGNRLAIGGPGEDGTDPNDLDRAAVFEHRDGNWVEIGDLDALQPPHGDKFGAAVALSDDFLVITSPGSVRGDRVTVFKLSRQEGGSQ